MDSWLADVLGEGLMPNRIVREAILSSESVCSLKWDAEVFYRRLMSIVDDYGRHEATLQLLRSKCYPLQTDAVRVADISRWMAACQKAGLILCYAVTGKQYLEVTKFGQQMRSHSKCPNPPANASSCEQPIADAHLGVVVVGGVSVVGGVEHGRLTEPRDEHRSMALDLGVDCQAELGKYRDYMAARGKRHKNEAAGFRNWLRKAGEYKNNRPKTVHEKRTATAEAMYRDTDGKQPRDITGKSERLT